MDVDEPTLDVFFGDLEDPRIDRTKKYPLVEIVFLTIIATLCGADSWQAIVLVGEERLDWLRKFFPFTNGIPSHDTIGRVFSLLDPKLFQDCFLRWVHSVATVTNGEIIAIDGKVSRASADARTGNPALYLVNAWAVKNGVSFGQVKVADKSNEITAIPELLKLLSLKGAVVTIDAIGAQKEIVNAIVSKGADFAIGLKANQPTLHDEALRYMETKMLSAKSNPENYDHQTNAGHGRVETRECFHVPIDFDWMPSAKDWPGVTSLIGILAERFQKSTNETSTELRLYISSLSIDAKHAQQVVRSHWGVENNLHGVLDVTFSDDKSTIRKDNAPQNYGIVKRWVMALLKSDKQKKGLSLKNKRMKALINPDYLESLWKQVN